MMTPTDTKLTIIAIVAIIIFIAYIGYSVYIYNSISNKLKDINKDIDNINIYLNTIKENNILLTKTYNRLKRCSNDITEIDSCITNGIDQYIKHNMAVFRLLNQKLDNITASKNKRNGELKTAKRKCIDSKSASTKEATIKDTTIKEKDK